MASPAATPLRLLIVEDSEDDAMLVVRQLCRDGYAPAWLRVDNADAMRAALQDARWDLILADYTMPGFSGTAALSVLKEAGLDLPFILVSGTIADETAVGAMRAGAHDYVLKSNRARLSAAISRELAEAVTRRERRRAADGLRFLAEASATLSASLDHDLTLRHVARLAVPFLADFCTVHAVEKQDRARWVTAAHVDPDQEAWARGIFNNHPLIDLTSEDPLAVALRTRTSRILPAATPGAWGNGPVHRLWDAGVRSAMIVPVIDRDHGLAVLSYFLQDEARSYGTLDLGLAEDLARRVAVALDNARLYSEAQHAVRARDTFLVSAAHEIKTPLTRIAFQLDGLQREVRGVLDGIPSARMVHRFDRANRHLQALARLVDHMIDVARLDTGQAPLCRTEVDLTDVVQRVLERLELEIERSGCQVTLESEGSLGGLWDKARLDDIVTSLVFNAIKYGAKKPVTIRAAGNDSHASLMVEDHGIGIADEDQSRIFERFERAVSTRHYSGFGLGLWVAWEAANALGGTIRVDSTLNEGATFTLELPRRPSAEHTALATDPTG